MVSSSVVVTGVSEVIVVIVSAFAGIRLVIFTSSPVMLLSPL